MTDNDIIKALECCIGDCEGKNCFNCPLYEVDDCQQQLNENALDLITRQQAEIENLKVENQSLRGAANSLKMHYEEAQAEIERLENHLAMAKKEIKKCVTHYKMACSERNDFLKQLKTAKSEAYKEFAERLKIEAMSSNNKRPSLILEGAVDCSCIDRVLKEMVGENNATT